ncbi:MAG: pantetheine-phosphate adenylyltransferase [Cryomorphaceae bacterium]|jgi:pantetheine-phosphate adenylyltransferase|nr:pantetheine-phosphate adenylyltransferase [Cryomorphaceae bacterium]
MKTALFPGSFDPLTLGHDDVVRRAAALFDRVVVGIGVNADKKHMFPLEQRMQWVRDAFADLPHVDVASYEGLTVEYAREIGAQYMVRGLRNPADFEFEKAIAQTNRELEPNIETVFFQTRARFAYIASSHVREVIRYRGDYRLFVPSAVRITS